MIENRVQNVWKVINEKIKYHSIKIKVHGNSIEPNIFAGEEIVIFDKKLDDIDIDDILLFQINSKLILHRVIYKEKIENRIAFL